MDVLPFFLSGIIIGSIYGLTTLGLSLIFGVLRVANVAHGSFIMIGAYTAFFAFTLWGIVPFLSAALGFGLGALMGYLVYLGVIKPLRKMGELHTLVALFALGMFIAEVARVLWGPDFVGYRWSIGSFSVAGLEVDYGKALGAVFALVVALAIDFMLKKTYLGRAVRAVVQDPVGAQVVGVNVDRVYAFAAALGIAITTMGGVLLTLFIPVGINPYMGGPYTLIGFVIAVLGGLGSVLGAYVAGLIFGIIESVGFYAFSYLGFAEPSQMALFTAFVLLLVILLFKPTGLLKL
ncbi:branched-chain amino acid ABC transporter permease [Pyrobaculum calidifontis]|uniref:Amino acid/amide ABC transporter membrane protein 1, HAAT family n=1 Tax=Pyrobaculum calidifontis (strain DSM 21063 / JCM 11548 / VA1) TaxID=410359 RepID=A3MUF6_PYRCJ|nr:branched-chain amino acid ABC transporter permease [Pyrobaculum calidifontis]ABO08273.1 amino acid/amide ABC transporter membrane protein 1, HAAT family [Pyrobaculum calidifontis JCM 11548]